MDKRISVIGAGNVGATAANEIARRDLAKEVILLDVNEGTAEGKALDLWQSSSINGYNSRVIGVTNDYERTKGSSVVVITAGVPRKPGMSRDDLIKTNASIVKDVTEKVIKYSPDAIIIIVSNPLDVMTYAANLTAKKAPNKIFGMAGILDSARYIAFIAEALDVSPLNCQALLLGGHGDTMVPLKRYTTVSGIPITQLMDDDTLDKILERTKNGGGELVKLMGTSAWYAPGAAAAIMVESIVKDQRAVHPVCASLNGEYGITDNYLGVPVILGKNGIERIIEIDLNKEETEMMANSAAAVKVVMKALDDMKLF